MRSRIERLVIFPFSIGCVSQSSVAVVDDPKKSKLEREQSEKEDESSDGEVNTKNSTLAKPNISLSFYRLIKNFKNLSQLFVYKEDDDDMKMEMEIGFPTDVKHVTQIGWYGNNSKATTIIKGCNWDNNDNNLNALQLFSSINPSMDSVK
ncbi:hypothetical protein MKX01_031844 [Papaver californicum]|nr:hypothetical protein MKX01_031844 [Papaver californicum]